MDPLAQLVTADRIDLSDLQPFAYVRTEIPVVSHAHFVGMMPDPSESADHRAVFCVHTEDGASQNIDIPKSALSTGPDEDDILPPEEAANLACALVQRYAEAVWN